MLVLRSLCLFLTAAALVGCSSDGLQPLQGTVTLDGKPLEGAAISFSPIEGGRPATGKTDADGKFTLASYKAGDGLPAGSYKVTVVKLDAKRQAQAAPSTDENSTEPQAMGNLEQGVSFVTPVKYSSPATTDLIVDVAAGMEPVLLEIKSK